MDLAELRVFLTVAAERSFSRAASKLHRTQPAVSQAIRRLEDQVGERLFDRSSKDGTLTEAGRVLRDYAERLQRLAEEAQTSVRELRELQRGRVLIGSNEGGVHMLLPLIEKFREKHSKILVDVRRVPARQVGVEVAQGSLDFGIVTFDPSDKRLNALALGPDELVLLVYPGHAFAGRDSVPIAEFATETVIAHSDRRNCAMRQSTFRLRSRAWRESSGPWNTRWAWRCCPGAAPWRRSRAASSWRSESPRCGCRGKCGWCIGRGSCHTPRQPFSPRPKRS
jgi:DNA-binding transcriptional LysR family regulator